jgi:hypothetical protein
VQLLQVHLVLKDNRVLWVHKVLKALGDHLRYLVFRFQ